MTTTTAIATATAGRIITVNLPSEESLLALANKHRDMAASYTIDCPEVYELAAADLKSIKAEINRLEDERTTHVKPLNEEVKFINALFKQATTILQGAEGTLKTAMLTYSTEQEKKAREEQARLEAQARAEREKLAAEARAAEAAGNTEVAAVLEATAAVVVAPTVSTAAPKVSGVSTRETWSAEVTSLIDLVKYVATHPENIGLIEANTKALNGMAKALNGAMSIPGVKSVATKSLATTSK